MNSQSHKTRHPGDAFRGRWSYTHPTKEKPGCPRKKSQFIKVGTVKESRVLGDWPVCVCRQSVQEREREIKEGWNMNKALGDSMQMPEFYFFVEKWPQKVFTSLPVE